MPYILKGKSQFATYCNRLFMLIPVPTASKEQRKVFRAHTCYLRILEQNVSTETLCARTDHVGTSVQCLFKTVASSDQSVR